MELNEAKAKINKYSKDKNINIQSAWDTFFFDELIYRLSISPIEINLYLKVDIIYKV